MYKRGCAAFRKSPGYRGGGLGEGVEERLRWVVGRNPQEGGDLRLQYCPELGSVPVDNMFVV